MATILDSTAALIRKREALSGGKGGGGGGSPRRKKARGTGHEGSGSGSCSTPFDDRILFFDRIILPPRPSSSPGTLEHVYLVNERKKDEDAAAVWSVYDYSVTSLAKKHLGEFDSEATALRIAGSRRWATDPTYKYYRVPPADMVASWAAAGAAASAAGTAMHARIEEFYLGKFPLEHIEGISPELDQFAAFHREHVRGRTTKLVPWRAELRIFDTDLRIAGSVDMIFAEEEEGQGRGVEKEEGTGVPLRLHIVDWKRSREIRREGFAGATCLTGPDPIRGRPDCNWTAYSLQLNIYRALIEKHMGDSVTVVSMGLGVFHPNNPDGKWQYLPVDRDDAGVEALFAERRAEVLTLPH